MGVHKFAQIRRLFEISDSRQMKSRLIWVIQKSTFSALSVKSDNRYL